MPTIPEMIPDVDLLLALEPEELAAKLLDRLREKRKAGLLNQGGMCTPQYISGELWSPDNPHGYARRRDELVQQAIVEAWAWLETQGLLVPAADINGQNGWRILSRRALRFADEREFASYVIARKLPREILDKRIANTVWSAFVRGEFDVAVLHALKAVEVAVREASGLTKMLGVPLMRAAFHPETGPLTDMEADGGERSGRSDLFAGAIGSYKNPQSHRDVNLDDPDEALEIVLLANHLLRIVAARIERRVL